MPPSLSAIILAAGFSSRMGAFKPALPLGRHTLLEECVALFRRGGIEDILVVTGHRAQEIGALAGRAGARVAHNPGFGAGMFSSIQVGVRHLTPGTPGFFLLPADMALVRPQTVRCLTSSWESAPAWVVHPVFAKRRGHPPLLGQELVPRILEAVSTQEDLRSLLTRVEAAFPHWVRELVVDDPDVLFDMDTQEDYRQALRRASRPAGSQP